MDIFVDTTGWYALADATDNNSGRAETFARLSFKDYGRLVCTNHVIGETYTLIRSKLGYDQAWRFMRAIRTSPGLRTVFVSKEQEQEAYRLLEKYRDQDFSFVDSTSFVVMERSKIQRCFGFDSHFLTAGFQLCP